MAYYIFKIDHQYTVDVVGLIRYLDFEVFINLLLIFYQIKIYNSLYYKNIDKSDENIPY